MFKIKTGYHLEILTPEIMKLLGSTKSKITKKKKKMKMLLIIVFNKIREFCIHLFLINRWVYYYISHLKILHF